MANRSVILTSTLLSIKLLRQYVKILSLQYLEFDLSVNHFCDLSDTIAQIFSAKSIKFSQH